MARNWDFAAKLLWPRLVDDAKFRRKAYYSDYAPIIETNDLNVGRALGPIQTYCLDMRLPPFTSIVVSKSTGIPGPGFVAWDVHDIEGGQSDVFSFDWSRIPNPFGGLSPSDDIASLARELVVNPTNSQEVYKKVPDRGVGQRVFRAALLEAYDFKCAMCGLSFSSALDAAHIVAWSKATLEQRLDVRNGLLLCGTHHKMLDGEWFKITRDYKIHFDDMKAEWGPYDIINRRSSTMLHGKALNLPLDKRLWPVIGKGCDFYLP